MDQKRAYGMIVARYREISDREWVEFVALIKEDLPEFKRRWKAWEARHRKSGKP